MAEGNQQMTRPGWKNEININSIILIVTAIVTGVGWGVNYQLIKSGQKTNSEAISRLETRDLPEIRSDVAELQSDTRTFANIEFRVKRLEDGFIGVTANTRDLERTINSMASDIRVMREIVERLDKSDSGQR